MADDLSFDDLIPNQQAASEPPDLSFDDLIPTPAPAAETPTKPIYRYGKRINSQYPTEEARQRARDEQDKRTALWDDPNGTANAGLPPMRPPALDTGMNVPESPQTQAAQQQSVAEGRRPAAMFPRGSQEPPLPPGMQRVETARGVFHYDPAQITPIKIKQLSRLGRENEILGLGPVSKDDAAARMAAGEPPLAVTERQPDGTEVKAAVGTPSTAPAQAAAIAAGAAPGNAVGVEPLESVIAQRAPNGVPLPPERPENLTKRVESFRQFKQALQPNDAAPLDYTGRFRDGSNSPNNYAIDTMGQTEANPSRNQEGMQTGEEAYNEKQAKVAAAEANLEEQRQRLAAARQRSEESFAAVRQPGKRGSQTEIQRQTILNEVEQAQRAVTEAERAVNAARNAPLTKMTAGRSAAEVGEAAIVNTVPKALEGVALGHSLVTPFLEGWAVPKGTTDALQGGAKALRGFTDQVDAALGGDPARKEEFINKLGAGAGSAIGFMLGGAGARAAGVTGAAASGVLGGAGQAADYYREAEAMGKQGYELALAYIAGGAIGATEMFGIGGMLERLDKTTGGGVRRYFGMMLREGGEEAVQEATQALLENMSKYGLFGKDVELTKDVAENALIGALLGMGMAGSLGIGALGRQKGVEGQINAAAGNPAAPGALPPELGGPAAPVEAPGGGTGTAPAAQPEAAAPQATQPEAAPQAAPDATTPPIDPDAAQLRILREAGWSDELIAEMSEPERQAALADAADAGIVDPGPDAAAPETPADAATASQASEPAIPEEAKPVSQAIANHVSTVGPNMAEIVKAGGLIQLLDQAAANIVTQGMSIGDAMLTAANTIANQKGPDNGASPASGTQGAVAQPAQPAAQTQADASGRPAAPQSQPGGAAAGQTDGGDQGAGGSGTQAAGPAGAGGISENGAGAQGDAQGQSGDANSRPRPAAGSQDGPAVKSATPTKIQPHRVATATGRSIEVSPMIVEARDLIASNDANYAADLQPRNRDRAASQAQIAEIASRLDPERLGASSEADRGSPIIGDDMMVESGNGRVMSIREAYRQNGEAARKYREWIAQQGADVSGFDEPVLVRRRDTQLSPEERKAFTVEANQSATLSMSASERALADARKLSVEMLGMIRNAEDLGAASNRDFVKAFTKALPQAEQGMMTTSDGALSVEGLTRLKNAVLAKAYGNASLLARVAEATSDEIKSISNALIIAAPEWAQFRADIEAGIVAPEMDITAELMDAVSRTADLRGRGMKMLEYLDQQDAFDPISATVEKWIRMFYNQRGTRAAGTDIMAERLLFYAREARKVSADAGLDFGLEPVTSASLMDAAAKKGLDDGAGTQGGLFESGGARNGANNADGGKAGQRSDTDARGQGTRSESAGSDQSGQADDAGADEETAGFDESQAAHDLRIAVEQIHGARELLAGRKKPARNGISPKEQLAQAKQTLEHYTKELRGTSKAIRDALGAEKLAQMMREARGEASFSRRKTSEKAKQEKSALDTLKTAEADIAAGRGDASLLDGIRRRDAAEKFLTDNGWTAFKDGKSTSYRSPDGKGWAFLSTSVEGNTIQIQWQPFAEEKPDADTKSKSDIFKDELANEFADEPAAKPAKVKRIRAKPPTIEEARARYEAADRAHAESFARHEKAREDHRARRMSSDEYLKIRDAHEAVKAEFDEAHAVYGKAMNRALKSVSPIDRLENYFRPGRIIKSYGGYDRVISFDRGTDSNWSVRVTATDKDGNDLNERVREHSTSPSARELAEWEKQNPVPLETKPAPVKHTTAKGAAISAVKNTVQASDAALNGIMNLFAPKNRLSSGLSFDEETWAAAKPMFITALQKYRDAANDIRAMIRLLIKELRARGADRETIANMEPYVIRFVDDVESGKISLDAEEAKGKPASFAQTVADHFLAGNGFKTIIEARRFAKENGAENLDAKQVEEAIEHGIVLASRQIVADAANSAEAYDRLVDLYGRQPRLATRTGTSIADQAYSTPAPLAFLAANAAKIDGKTTVFEPSAGNGMLLMTASLDNAIANEKNDARLANLKALGFKTMQADASDGLTVQQAIADNGSKLFDAIIANPPFGVVREGNGSKRFDLSFVQPGYVTNEIDHAISLRALEGMKPDGTAVLILGGINKLAKTDEARSDAYNGKAKREFYKTLYDNYNVVDHYTVAGELYERQGAGYPVDVIVIRGYGKSARSLPAVDVPTVFRSWDALREKLDVNYAATSQGADSRPNGKPAGGSRPAGAESADAPGAGDGGRGGRNGGGRGSVKPGGVRAPASTGKPELPVDANAGSRGNVGAGGANDSGGAQSGGPDVNDSPRQPRVAKQEQETSGQVAYTARSGRADSLGTLVPANMRDSTQNALAALEEREGPVDQFVSRALELKPGELEKYFAAEQVDAIALAISNLERNAGFIIGDQTGIGKGRVNAAIIRYALTKGYTPIFVTEKAGLYGDMYRDLGDIGIKDFLKRDVQILMTNGNEKVPLDDEGLLALKSPPPKALEAIISAATAAGELAQHDVLFTTYSQMQTVKGEMTARNRLLDALAPNAIVILDESHNAGGTGGQGGMISSANAPMTRADYVRALVTKAKGVFYSSATYAKRPQVLDLYSKTDMVKAVQTPDGLSAAIAKGGVPMQQAVAAMLAEAGQYIRRERSFAGVTYDAPLVDVNLETYDQFSRALAAVNTFSKVMANAAKVISDEIKADAQMVSHDGSTGGAGAASTNFTAIMHNLINQMLLSMKAPVAARMALDAIERGEKPVITVANTMESFLSEFAEDNDVNPGDPVTLGFKDLLRRYLDRTRTITIRRPFMKKGEKAQKKYLSDAELGPAGVAAYNAALKIIESGDFGAMPISPIDHMIAEIEKAGYKVGEITGRGSRINYSKRVPTYEMRPGEAVKTAGRRKAISEFNSGKLDAMILNQAGATGLSLHASEKFADQRKRVMILAQPEGNIDTHMQMLGRVHRTGQVVTPSYFQLVANIPAEKRPAAVLAKKMASLNASTTASRGGALTAENTPDFMNEYGDKIAAEVMNESPDIHKLLGEPISDFEDPADAMRKVTGRIPLLPVKDQEKLYDLLEETYRNFLAEKQAAGENMLEAQRLDLDAVPVETTEIVNGEGDSPFTRAVIAETVDAKKQSKPYNVEDVLRSGKTALKLENLPADTEAAFAELAKRGQVTMDTRRQMALDDFRQYRKDYTADIEGETKLNQANAKLDANQDRFLRIANLVHVGARMIVRTDEESVTGIVVQVAKSGDTQNPLALGSWKMTIAVPGRGTFTLPFTRLETQITEESGDVYEIKRSQESFSNLSKLFDSAAREAREQRIILTGNILKAYDFAGRRGQIVNFTMRDGQVRQGILMPVATKTLADVVKDKGVPIEHASEVLAELRESGSVVSGGDEVRLDLSNGTLTVSVPASKAKGGRYYLNPPVREILAREGADFSKRGDRMMTWLYGANIEPMINALMRSGAIFERPYQLPGQTGQAKPRAMAAPRSLFTPQAQAAGLDEQAIVDQIGEIVARVGGLTGFRTNVVRSRIMVNGREAQGIWDSISRVLNVSLHSDDIANTAHHELFHALQTLGVFDARETELLTRESPRLRRLVLRTRPDLSESDLPVGEATAYAYGYYAVARDRGLPMSELHIGVRRIFEKAFQIMRRVRNWAQGLGFQTAEDIFERARTGGYRGQADESRSWDSPDMAAQIWNDGEGARPMAAPRRAPTERNAGSRTVDYWADRFTRLRELQRRFQADTGRNPVDVHGALGALDTRIAERIETMEQDELVPMLEKVEAAGGLDRVHRFLYTRHAEERNDYIASINPRMPDGGSGIDTATARAEQQAFQQAPDYQALLDAADAIYAMNDLDITRRVAAGLMSAQQAQSLRGQYQFYVPLRGFEGDEYLDGPQGGGQGVSVAGNEARRALGRRSEADNVVAQTVTKTVEGIVRAEKNRVDQRLLRLATQLEAQYGPDSPMAVKTKVPMKQVMGSNGQVTQIPDTDFAYRPDVVTAKVGGKPVYIELRGENKLADALKNAVFEHEDAGLRWISAVTQVYSRLRTAWNVFFAPVNFVRDTEDALIAATAMIGKGGKRAYAKALPVALREAFNYIVRGQRTAAFDRFRHAGGKMSWAKLRSLDEIKTRIDRELNGVSLAKRPFLALQKIVEGWNDIHENVVRYALFKAALDRGQSVDAAAKVALEGTLNFHRRGSGDVFKWLRAAIPFLNPSIQSPLRAARLIRDAGGLHTATGRTQMAVGVLRAARKTYLGVTLAGFFIGIWNYLIGGDDDDGVPYWDKAQEDWRDEKNLLIYTGGRNAKNQPNAAVVPAFPEIMFPYKVGASLASAILGKRGALTIAKDLAKSAYGLTPLEGRYATLGRPQPLAAIDNIRHNENWLGNKIHPEPRPDQRGVPRHMISWASTEEGYKTVAKALYEATGGMVNLHPEDVRHLTREVMGGYNQPVNYASGNDDRLPPVARNFYAPGADLHRKYETKRVDELTGEANTARAKALAVGDKPGQSRTERAQSRRQNRDAIQETGATLGPRGGVTTPVGEIVSTMRAELNVLNNRMNTARKAGQTDQVERIQSRIDETRKRYRVMADGVKSGRVEFRTIEPQLKAARQQARNGTLQ